MRDALQSTPSMSEIHPVTVMRKKMPEFRDVKDMPVELVFHYLTRIRKSKFKG